MFEEFFLISFTIRVDSTPSIKELRKEATNLMMTIESIREKKEIEFFMEQPFEQESTILPKKRGIYATVSDSISIRREDTTNFNSLPFIQSSTKRSNGY